MARRLFSSTGTWVKNGETSPERQTVTKRNKTQSRRTTRHRHPERTSRAQGTREKRCRRPPIIYHSTTKGARRRQQSKKAWALLASGGCSSHPNQHMQPSTTTHTTTTAPPNQPRSKTFEPLHHSRPDASYAHLARAASPVRLVRVAACGPLIAKPTAGRPRRHSSWRRARLVSAPASAHAHRCLGILFLAIAGPRHECS